MTARPLVLVERDGPVALVTMNRPEARNAMNSEHAAAFVEAIEGCQDAAAIIVTGKDPAFCAGLDLKELGSAGFPRGDFIGVVARSEVPVIGAVNGAAVTGGLEMALRCDFLIGSERATFADTHARVGVYPGGGMTVLLPQRVGVAFAREMSLTGNFVDAETALRVGLVQKLVPHASLVEDALGLAHDIASTVPEIRQAVRRGIAEATSVSHGLEVEQQISREMASSVRPEDVESRRRGIMERSRSQRS